MERFETELRKNDAGGVTAEVPLEVKAIFGRARAPVKATVNGHTFRTTIAVYGGRSYLGFNKQVQQATGIEPGETITVEIEPDDEPRTVDVPEELAAALAQDTVAREIFGGLSYTHRREYVEWINEAKREQTRQTRVARTIEMLREGTKCP